MLEGPGKEIILLRAHYHEKQREVSPFLNAVTIEVGTDAHAIAVWTGVKGRRVEDDCTTINTITEMPVDVGDFPNENPISGPYVQNVLVKA